MPLALLLALAVPQRAPLVLAERGTSSPMAAAAPAIRARARRNPASYVREGDYPSGARSRHEQGQVRFELAVSPAGRATACRVLESSGSTELDDRTCRIMVERARFEPARNARDVAVRDAFRSSIRWLIAR